MTLNKIKNQASEQSLYPDLEFSHNSILENKIISLFLRNELKLFMKRNLIEGKEACPRCLKAHLLKAAKMNRDVISALSIEELISHPAGHHGYYLDSGNLIKL